MAFYSKKLYIYTCQILHCMVCLVCIRTNQDCLWLWGDHCWYPPITSICCQESLGIYWVKPSLAQAASQTRSCHSSSHRTHHLKILILLIPDSNQITRVWRSMWSSLGGHLAFWLRFFPCQDIQNSGVAIDDELGKSIRRSLFCKNSSLFPVTQSR